MPNERRQGGVVLGAEVGLDLLLEALRLFPGARIELIGERPLAPEDGVACELIEPGRNGLLFTPGSARELARRLAWAEAFPERIRQMGECARADYLARFIADWSYQKLYGERRRYARV